MAYEVIICFILGFFLHVSFACIAVWSESQYIKAWKNMNSFTKYSVKFGFFLFLLIPGIEGHLAKDFYSTKVMLHMVSAMANGFLIIGLINYAKQIHSSKGNKKNI